MPTRFRPRQRLRTGAEFDAVVQAWRRASTGALFLLVAAPNGRAFDRLGLAVSRRVGGAVEPQPGAPPAARELPTARDAGRGPASTSSWWPEPTSSAAGRPRWTVSFENAVRRIRAPGPAGRRELLLLLVEAYRVAPLTPAGRSLPLLAELQRLRRGGHPPARRAPRGRPRRPPPAPLSPLSRRGHRPGPVASSAC